MLVSESHPFTSSLHSISCCMQGRYRRARATYSFGRMEFVKLTNVGSNWLWRSVETNVLTVVFHWHWVSWKRSSFSLALQAFQLFHLATAWGVHSVSKRSDSHSGCCARPCSISIVWSRLFEPFNAFKRYDHLLVESLQLWIAFVPAKPEYWQRNSCTVVESWQRACRIAQVSLLRAVLPLTCNPTVHPLRVDASPERLFHLMRPFVARLSWQSVLELRRGQPVAGIKLVASERSDAAAWESIVHCVQCVDSLAAVSKLLIGRAKAAAR